MMKLEVILEESSKLERSGQQNTELLVREWNGRCHISLVTRRDIESAPIRGGTPHRNDVFGDASGAPNIT